MSFTLLITLAWRWKMPLLYIVAIAVPAAILVGRFLVGAERDRLEIIAEYGEKELTDKKMRRKKLTSPKEET